AAGPAGTDTGAAVTASGGSTTAGGAATGTGGSSASAAGATKAANGLAKGDTGHCAGPKQFKVALFNGVPPCVPTFVGDNGGATYQGVTKDTIKVIWFDSKP